MSATKVSLLSLSIGLVIIALVTNWTTCRPVSPTSKEQESQATLLKNSHTRSLGSLLAENVRYSEPYDGTPAPITPWHDCHSAVECTGQITYTHTVSATTTDNVAFNRKLKDVISMALSSNISNNQLNTAFDATTTSPIFKLVDVEADPVDAENFHIIRDKDMSTSEVDEPRSDYIESSDNSGIVSPKVCADHAKHGDFNLAIWRDGRCYLSHTEIERGTMMSASGEALGHYGLDYLNAFQTRDLNIMNSWIREDKCDVIHFFENFYNCKIFKNVPGAVMMFRKRRAAAHTNDTQHIRFTDPINLTEPLASIGGRDDRLDDSSYSYSM